MDSPPSDDEIIECMMKILSESNLEMLSMKLVRQSLEKQFNCSLKDKKELLSHTLTNFINTKITESVVEESIETIEMVDDPVEDICSIPKKVKVNPFTKPLKLSYELAEFIGSETASRPEVVKQLWSYIKENSLQNPKDKREIICNDVLINIFKRKKITMFSMNKILSNLMKNASDLQENDQAQDETNLNNSEDNDSNDSDSVNDNSEEEEKPKKKQKLIKSNKNNKENNLNKKELTIKDEIKLDESNSNSKEPKMNGFHKLLYLSTELSEFLGLEKESRCQVVKKLWAYIKENNLQNDKKKSEILLDQKLKNIFKVNKMTMFSMNKLLTKHLYSNDD